MPSKPLIILSRLYYNNITHFDIKFCNFRPSTCFQSDIYQISYWYNWISWWWALECSKQVQNWNKHIQKRNVRQVGH